MGQIKHKMGKVGGGVDISHKSKMSNAAKNQMSFPGGMPGPGNYGSTNNVVGKGMTKYLAGESVGMRRMDPMYNGKAGTQPDDFLQFDKSKSTGPAKKKRKLTVEQQKLVNEIRSKRAKKEQASKAAKIQKKKVNKELDTFLKAGGEVSSGPGKYNRANKTKEKAQDAKDEADKKIKKLNKTQTEVDSMKRSKAKADRLAKRQKRQEGRAERKKIRKAGLSRGEKRKQIIDSREKQNSTKKDNTQTGVSGLGMTKAGPAKKRSKRLAERSQAAFDKDKVVKAKQTTAIEEGKDKKAERLSKKRTRLQEKDIRLQRKSFEKASEGK